MSGATYNPRMERRRVWECASNHGPIMIIGPADAMSQCCPLCERIITKSRPLDIAVVIDCPFPFIKQQTMPIKGDCT